MADQIVKQLGFGFQPAEVCLEPRILVHRPQFFAKRVPQFLPKPSKTHNPESIA
jgi:hypothetical protein